MSFISNINNNNNNKLCAVFILFDKEAEKLLRPYNQHVYMTFHLLAKLNSIFYQMNANFNLLNENRKAQWKNIYISTKA